jgi:hypothetical protein
MVMSKEYRERNKEHIKEYHKKSDKQKLRKELSELIN